MFPDDDFHANEGTGAHPAAVILVVVAIIGLLALFLTLLWPYLRPA